MGEETRGATILVVEDEPDVRDILEYLFTVEGYTVLVASSAGAAWQNVSTGNPDLVILDVELPDESGLAFCRRVKPLGIPVIMVSSHDRDDEVVAGLETGADDYVRKPFNNRELLLRVRRLLEQNATAGAGRSTLRVVVGDLLVDREAARVWRGEREIHLTPTEWNILDLLVGQRGQAQSVERILEHVWHTTTWEGGAEMVKVNIRRLRHKIERDPQQPQIVINRRGRGYLVE
ncbi:MAG: response regulator transcription factor [Alkalispirochaeta sp.]